MRYAAIALCILATYVTPSYAQLSINFGSPGVSIGINLGGYPTLQRIPGYPVYYAPGVNSNYFFYDGLYWDFDGDRWYASSWYNGPWYAVDPFEVPVFLLRVPVRYYRHAPAYFRGWRSDAAPRWGDHWGQSWQSRRSGWDQWNRSSAPAPAPLPTYQRQYAGNRYPQASQQAVIQTQNYRYTPHDAVAQQNFQHQRTQAQAAPPQERAAPPQRVQRQQQQQAPRSQPQPQPVEQRQAPQQQRPQEAPRQQRQAPQQQQQQQQQQRQQEAPRQQPQQERAPQGKGEEQGRGRQNDNKDNKEGKDNKER